MQKRWRNGARERVREGTEQTVMASATTNVQPIRYVYVYVFVFICPKVFNKIKSIFSLTGIVPSSSLALFPFPSYHSIPPLLTWFADLLLDIRLLFLLVLYVFFFTTFSSFFSSLVFPLYFLKATTSTLRIKLVPHRSSLVYVVLYACRQLKQKHMTDSKHKFKVAIKFVCERILYYNTFYIQWRSDASEV